MAQDVRGCIDREVRCATCCGTIQPNEDHHRVRPDVVDGKAAAAENGDARFRVIAGNRVANHLCTGIAESALYFSSRQPKSGAAIPQSGLNLVCRAVSASTRCGGTLRGVFGVFGPDVITADRKLLTNDRSVHGARQSCGVVHK